MTLDYTPIRTNLAVEQLSTSAQRERVAYLMANWAAKEMLLSIDSSLPDGYIAFRLTAPAANNSTTFIYGGIAPDGATST